MAEAPGHAQFSEAECQAVASALRERYRLAVALEPIDAEMRLDPASPVLTGCPGVYWGARGAHFVIVRLPDGRYRAQFYYRPDQHYWTGRPEFDSLVDCVIEILRAQADDERQRQGAESGTVGTDFADAEE